MKNLTETERAKAIQAIRKRYKDLLPILNEQGRRLFAAAEARALGRGGSYVVEKATGMGRRTILQGMKELETGEPVDPKHQRKPGGGRKKNRTAGHACQRNKEPLGTRNARRPDASFAVGVAQFGAYNQGSERKGV